MGRGIRLLVALSFAVAAVAAGAGRASAGQSATVLTVAPEVGVTNLVVGVGIPKTVWNQSIAGKKAWALDVSMTYLSVNNTIETVDSGVVLVADTLLIGQVDGNTNAVQVTISFAGHPDPGNQPSFTGTATLLKQ